MYLDNWMIVAIILTFGLCAFVSRRGGVYAGSIKTLQLLEQQRFIKIEEDGTIKRWAPYNETPEPVKKTRKRK